MSAPSTLPLIAGAGPVGLAAALFLARDGTPVRIIDRADRPAPHSKALAVNPRTLEILEPSGLTGKIIALGRPIRGARFWRGGDVLVDLSFDGLRHKYPFMVALSQRVTERLLAEALAAAGGTVERGVELAGCRNVAGGGVEADLRRPGGGADERVACPWLLAADGAHSTARRELGIGFEGTTFDREWHLADVPLDTPLPEDRANIIFLDDGGFLFCIRVVEDGEATSGPVWRVMGNMPDPVARLPAGRAAGPPVWVSSFKVAHRIADRLGDGGVFLAGDAGHIHSPVGARGMNLGIEDAWVFSRCVAAGRTDRYGPARRAVDRRVVKAVEQVSRLARGESAVARFVRNSVLPRVAGLGAVRRRMIGTVTGLDHPLPEM